MKRIGVSLFLVTLLSLTFGAAALADHGQDPIGSCPGKFELHHAMHHDHTDHPHHHVGVDTDKNGDGWLCVKHVSSGGDIHVHIDNNVPLRD